MSALMEIGTRLRAGLEQSPLWHRWQHLPPRDRLALALLGGFLALVLFYLAVWSPVAARVERARAYQQQQLALFTYIQSNADRARRQGARSRVELAPDQLQGLVTSSAQKQGLALERLDNEGNGGLLVTLSQASFESMLKWLAELDKRGVTLTEASLDKVATGKVDARLTLMVAGQGR
ncbi:type II secretion system protein M [Metapseudomonas otitidis]|uniref:type II secretion system protein M n=1 Tax=Metapseudomonas otitidis TaxID=319939 RepID=UPI0008E61C5F|nr:type II secretion system protein M [Pseudomonas otitidis]MCO7556418.1 type II secretion system protein M [Pseudomonas otitidis]SFA67284.1 general secretion pathway protein M [Pseudomonas otitidis]